MMFLANGSRCVLCAFVLLRDRLEFFVTKFIHKRWNK